MTPYRVLLVAENEAFQASRRYNRRLPGLGDRFVRELEAVYQRISAHPWAAALVARPAAGREVRQLTTRRFPYVVTFEVLPAEAVVLQVRHAKLSGQP